MKLSRLTHTVFSAALAYCAGSTSLVYADDTELYLGALGGSQIRHNVLFVLDTSRSMRDEIKGTGKTRIETLQEAMDSLIAGLDNVNVGIMRMNGMRPPSDSTATLQCNTDQMAAGGQRQGTGSKISWDNVCYLPTGGTVLFPVADLDAPLIEFPSEGGRVAISVPVIASEDDASQTIAAATATFVDDQLDIAAAQCDKTDEQTLVAGIISNAHDDAEDASGNVLDGTTIEVGNPPAGFIFAFEAGTTGVLPFQAPIINAQIDFVAQADGASDVNVIIAGEDTTAPSDFSNGAGNITNRALTNEVVDWTGIVSVSAEDTLTTPDLAAIVQEIVNKPGWNNNLTTAAASPADGNPDYMSILMSDGAGPGRVVYSRNGNSAKAAKLSVTYCNDPNYPDPVKQKVGVRFQDVRVPQGATVTEAYIDFTAANPSLNQDGSAGSDFIEIYGEDADTVTHFGLSGDGGQDLNSRTNRTSASTNWTVDEMGSWATGNAYSTPNIASVVQEITDRGNWCGGNSMALLFEGTAANVMRAATSFDGGAPPVLRIAYDNSGVIAPDTGCTVATHSVPVTQSNHDARMDPAGIVGATLNGLPMGSTSDYTVGTIFHAPISPGSRVVSARLVFTARNATALGNSNLVVNAEASDDAADFTETADDLSALNRPRISGTGIPVSLDVPPATDNTPFPLVGTEIGFDVKPIVEAVVARPGWAYDNKMALFVTNGTNNIRRRAWSFDGDPTRAPRLELEVQEDITNLSNRTVRDRLFEINDTLKESNLLGWTPSTETLFEAALYWRGKDVRFGKTRGVARIQDSATGQLGFANGVDYTQWMNRTLTSHPDSHTGGTYATAGCEFEHSNACVQDVVNGSPTYVSPFTTGLECSQNFMIFLTDGEPTFVNDATEADIIAEFDSITGCSADSSFNAQGAEGRCAREIIDNLWTEDQLSGLSGNQIVQTHTIGFNAPPDAYNWLQQLATAGGGTFKTASTATELLTVFDTIFASILSVPRSFAVPSIATNAFNRLFSREDVYFGLFLPESTNRWSGNVKKYRICTDPTLGGSGTCDLGEIIDANNVAAIDPATGLFSSSAESLWTNVANDGLKVEEGGAGGEINDYTQRTIYTDIDQTNGTATAGLALSATGYHFDASLWDSNDISLVRDAVCPNASVDTSTPEGRDCRDRMLWLLGKDIHDEDSDDTRWWFHDVLHSSPIAFTYNKVGNTFIDKVFVGSNEGGLHMINGETGVEEWAFIPNALLGNQIALFDNTGMHAYGLDATPVLRRHDVNGDGIIDPSAGDFAHVIVNQRRGGGNIYALDVTPTTTLTSNTDTVTPRFLWRIDGGSGNFARMSQSWSSPIVATLATPGALGSIVPKDVLLFAGGYDPALDSDDGTGIARNFGTEAGDPNIGNAIYVVDADTGERIFWISSSATAAPDAINVPDMKFAIPSDLKVFDSDGDGFDDRIYVGDSAGQVWRVDLDGVDPGGSSPKGNTVVGRLAHISSLAADNTTANERRFFYPPAVAQVIDTEFSDAASGEYDYVTIGTGNRANPIDMVVRDRFYAFRDTTIGKMTDSNSDNLADGYPSTIAVGTSNAGPIDNADLIDVTDTFFGDPNSSAQYRSALGWFIDLPSVGSADGEKNLATSDISNGVLIFTSYVPATPDPTKPCEPVEGSGRAFNLDILSTKAVIDWDGPGGSGSGANPEVSGRVQDIDAGGIPSSTPIFTPDGVTVLVGSGEAAKNLGKIAELPRFNTYWNEEQL